MLNHMRMTAIIEENLFEHARQLASTRKKTALVPVLAPAWYPIRRGVPGFREAEGRLKFQSRGMDMTYRGKVEKGTVVLPPEANLPDGTEVQVEPVAPNTLAERLKEVIGAVHGGPPDWAENHDHYIHGTPKK